MELAEKSDYARPHKEASLRIERHQVTVFFLLLLCLSWPYMILTAHHGDSPARMLPLILVGPSVSAFIVVYAARGTAGVRELGRMLCRAKAPRFTYLLIFIGLPTCFLGAAYAVAGIWYPDQVAAPSTNSIVAAIVNFGILFVFVGLREEFGWRGLALTRLQERRGPMTASLFVGLM